MLIMVMVLLLNVAENKVRINKYDNLKGFAIILIVLGHYINFTNSMPFDFFHNFIHMIHLPIFFFVAGYFSKIREDQPIKAFKRLMVPFIIFCILYALFKHFVLLEPVDNLFLYPGRGLWFLIALFTMKMLLPIFDKFKYPVATSFILALLVGFLNFKAFGLSRMFCYMPVYLIGFYYKDYSEYFSQKHNEIHTFLCRKSTLTLITFLTIATLAVAAGKFSFDVICFKDMYYSFTLSAVIKRVIVISLGIVFTLLANQLMTNSKSQLTKIGINSMAVYLLHIFTIVEVWHLLDYTNKIDTGLTAVLLIVLTLAAVLILSRDVVTRLLNSFTDGVYDLIVK